MQLEDRPIHFSVELIHPPAMHPRHALQKLYYDLSQTKAAYDNTDFSQAKQGRFFSRRGPKAQSIVVFLPDRVVIVEEWVDISLATYLDKVQELGRRVMADLGIARIVAEAITLRTTFALSHFADARIFLLEQVCQQADRILPHFQRPLATGGLRFVFPETPDHAGTLHVLIESYRHSQNEVFVEVKGVFANTSITADNISQVNEHIQLCRRFVTNHVFPFLNQYDVPQAEHA